jgi:hypothetical protein
MRVKISSAWLLLAVSLPAQACWLCGTPTAGPHLNNASLPAGELMYSSSAPSTASAGPLVVPAYNSRPSAAAKIFLDFDGDVTSNWNGYVPGTTPAYDTDGDASGFSGTEISNITEIWKRVSEKYSPFNINVTTVDPGNSNDRETVRVVIGGTGSWFGLAGGVAWPGGFYNGYPNTVFVFPKNLANGVPKYTAEASAHEAGHSFGLDHQSDYVGTTKTDEYSDYDGVTKAPVMGKSYHTQRGLWWKGPSSSGYNIIQDDMSVINSINNGFGYRPDDAGNSIATGTTISVAGDGTLAATGVIEQTSDVDCFNFTTLGGAFSFNIANAEFGGMLDVSAWLYRNDGLLLNSVGTTEVLSEAMNGFLDPGTYTLMVGSAGNYGDVGQYRFNGTITPVTVPEPAAVSLMLLLIAPAFRRRY